MTFDARIKAEELKNSVRSFYFLDLEGAQWELPNTQLLTGTQVTRLMGGDADELMKEINAGAYEAIQRMPMGVGEELAMAWIEHGGDTGKEDAESPETPTAG